MEQHNPHHTLDLGSHCIKSQNCFNALLKELNDDWYILGINRPDFDLGSYPKLEIASKAMKYHDIGKPYTCFFEHKNGSIIAHYYNHENYGSYIMLTTKTGLAEEDKLLAAFYINEHMKPYATKTLEGYLDWCNKHNIPSDDTAIIYIMHLADELAH